MTSLIHGINTHLSDLSTHPVHTGSLFEIFLKKGQFSLRNQINSTVALCWDPAFLDKFEKIRIKVGLVLVAICDKTEYTN
jgi:hypothetical protein